MPESDDAAFYNQDFTALSQSMTSQTSTPSRGGVASPTTFGPGYEYGIPLPQPMPDAAPDSEVGSKVLFTE